MPEGNLNNFSNVQGGNMFSKIISLIRFPVKHLQGYALRYTLYIISKICLLAVFIFQPFAWAYVLSSIYELNSSKVYRNIVILLVCYALQLILSFADEKLKNSIKYGMVTDVKTIMINSVVNFKMGVINNTKVGEFVSKFHSDVVEAVDFWVDYFPNFIIEICKIVVIGILISIVDINLFCIIVIVSIVFAFVFLKFGKEIRRRYTEFRKTADIYFSNMYETMNNLKEIKNLGLKKYSSAKSAEIFDDIRLGELNCNDLSALSQFVTSLIDVLIIFTVLFWSAHLVLSHTMSVTKFVVFFTYATQFSSSIKEVSRANSKIQQSSVSFERINNIMFDMSLQEVHVNELHMDNSIDTIRLKDVKFSYDGDNITLDHINTTIVKNTLTAIVGPSGNGKSTVLHLLNRLYESYGGEILINGIEQRTISESDFRKKVTRVFQEPLLFNISVEDNLRIICPSASHEDIADCCRQTGIHEFIMSLQDGYSTIINENSNNISVGQKQRIAIARALLSGAEVLLFDEITSALDNEAQLIITNTIQSIRNNKTIIMVSHKISNITDADKIIVLSNGSIEAEGTHEELLLTCELYKNLFLLENKE